MKQELSMQSTQQKRQLKSIWKQVGEDYVVHNLAGMKNAIVVAFYTPNFPTRDITYYGISPRSYFPFSDEQISKKFNNHIDCCEFAESIIKTWVESLFVSFNPPENNPILHHVEALPEPTPEPNNEVAEPVVEEVSSIEPVNENIGIEPPIDELISESTIEQMNSANKASDDLDGHTGVEPSTTE